VALKTHSPSNIYLLYPVIMVCPRSRSFARGTSTWMHAPLSGGDPLRVLAFLSQPRLFGELKRLESARAPEPALPPESSRAQPIAESPDGIIRRGKRQIARHSASTPTWSSCSISPRVMPAFRDTYLLLPCPVRNASPTEI
jgi:hypothetical protein